jgi:tight adherence protein C
VIALSELSSLLTLPVIGGPLLFGLAVYLLLREHPNWRSYPTLREQLDALDEARRQWSSLEAPPGQSNSPAALILGPLIEDAGRLVQRLQRLAGLETGDQLAHQLALVQPTTSIASFTGQRVALTVASFILLPLLNYLRLTWPGLGDWPWPGFFGLALVGALLPRWELDRQLSARRRQIRRELPRLMRSLCTTLEGGRTMPEALDSVCLQNRGLIVDELRLAYQHQLDGHQATLAQALRAMAERNNVPELTSMVTVIVQSLDRGLSAAVVLRKQIQILNSRRQAELQAASGRRRQAMILPLIGLVIPILLIVILAPAGARVGQALGTTGGGNLEIRTELRSGDR